MAFLRYEERIRIERANGLRGADVCSQACGCTPYDDAFYAGKTFSEVAATPLRMNAVCPHPKVVVPVTPAWVVEEPVKVIKSKYPKQPFRLVDFNPCDGRVHGVLETVSGSALDPVHSATTVTIETKVEDTVHDFPHEVTVVKQSLEDVGDVAQPPKTGEKTAKKPKTVNVDNEGQALETSETEAVEPSETPVN